MVILADAHGFDDTDVSVILGVPVEAVGPGSARCVSRSEMRWPRTSRISEADAWLGRPMIEVAQTRVVSATTERRMIDVIRRLTIGALGAFLVLMTDATAALAGYSWAG